MNPLDPVGLKALAKRLQSIEKRLDSYLPVQESEVHDLINDYMALYVKLSTAGARAHIGAGARQKCIDKANEIVDLCKHISGDLADRTQFNLEPATSRMSTGGIYNKLMPVDLDETLI